MSNHDLLSAPPVQLDLRALIEQTAEQLSSLHERLVLNIWLYRVGGPRPVQVDLASVLVADLPTPTEVEPEHGVSLT